jgi:glycosyltransferase involved in cell wall biosynthesis
MRQRLGPAAPEIEVLPNGIDLAGFEPASPAAGAPVIGYLARMIPEKGFDLMVAGFVHLRTVLGDTETRLHLAGAATAEDEPGIAAARGRLAAAGLADSVEWSMNITREEKLAVLRSLTLFSVPAVYHEAFGLYAIEAMACGVPLVQPEAASFPEIVGGSGAGVLVEPDNPVALARAWQELLQAPARLRELGECGLRAARETYAVEVMRERFKALAR